MLERGLEVVLPWRTNEAGFAWEGFPEAGFGENWGWGRAV